MSLPLLPNPRAQFFGSDGKPLVGGKVYTYAAGTSTPQATYTDTAGTVPNTNPIILDARGEAVIFWSGSYKVTLKTSADVTIYTQDNVTAQNLDNYVTLANLAATGGSALVGTPETTLYKLLYERSALSVVRGPKTFARTWQECLDQSADISQMRGFALQASTTGGAGKTVYKVWNDSDDVNTTGSLRWAVAQAKANGGGRIIGVPVGQHTVQLRSRIYLDFDNVTLDFPGRNWRFGALNDVEMFRFAGKNQIIRRVSTFRYPHYTAVDNQFIEYSAANTNITAGQSTFAVSFPFFASSDLRITKNKFVYLTEGVDYSVTGGGGPNGSTGNIILSDAVFTASMAGTTTLTVSAVASGTLAVGQTVYDSTGAVIGTVASLGTGTGGTGTYILSASATKSSQAMASSAGVASTDIIRVYGKIYQQDGFSVRPELCDQVWIDQCTFTDHTDGACDITSALVNVGVAANALVPGVRYEIITAGTTTWTAVGAANNTVGTTFIATGVGSGTGVANTAKSRITVSRCMFRHQFECMAIGSSATSAQTPAPSWSATALDQNIIVSVTLDRNVFDGVSQRSPRVGALAYVHSINNVHVMAAYRLDDGTVSPLYAAWANTGGKLYSQADYLRPVGTDTPTNGMYATTTAWDAGTRIGPGAFNYSGTVAETGATLVTANTSYAPAPGYSIAADAVPSTNRLDYVFSRMADAGAETAPLSEMTYTYVTKATGDGMSLYPDGIYVIAAENGYRVRTLPSIPATGTNPITSFTAGSLAFPRGVTISIVSDVLTLRDGSAYYAMDTEGAAATDNLATINAATGSTLPDGYILGLRTASNSRAITLISGGNIRLPTGPIVLDSIDKEVWLRWDTTNSGWRIISASGRAEGEYTPTLTNVANAGSLSVTRCFWARENGSAYVTVWFNIAVTPALTATQTDIGMTLPVASNIAVPNDIIGSGSGGQNATLNAAIVLGDVTNDRATIRYLSNATTASAVIGSFRYKVL